MVRFKRHTKTYQQGGAILMDIIHQVMEIITQEYYDNLERLMQGEARISDIAKNLENMLREVGSKLTGEALERLDEAILESRERKREWHVQRRRDEKSIATVLGETNYMKSRETMKRT
jgi:hypothetical protein